MLLKIKNGLNDDSLIGAIGLTIGLLIFFYFIPETIVTVVRRRPIDPYLMAVDFAPKVWSLVLILSSTGLLIQGLFFKENGKINFDKSHLTVILRMGFLFFLMFLYVFLQPYSHFIIRTILFLMISMFFFGSRHFFRSLIISVSVAFSTYYFFYYFLYIKLS